MIFDDDEDLFNWNLAATADVLPTNSVLHCWKEISKAQSFCKLCNTKKGSLRHTLCGCQVALRQGRQTWRHDSVLLCIYQAIRQLRNRGLASQTRKRKANSKSEPTNPRQTKFISHGYLDDSGPSSPTPKSDPVLSSAPHAKKTPLFESSDDWKLQFDVCVKKDGQVKNSPFPPHIAASKCRPDGVIWSDKLKKVLWIELTSPWEENMNDWHFKKLRKYQKLERTAKRNGWNVTLLYIEVGARGYINNKWCSMSKTLGITNKESKALRHQSSTIAQKCSFYIYLSRANKEWGVRPLLQNHVGSSNDA